MTTATLDNRAVYRKLARIAVPISIQGIVSATLGLIDNLMVGFLGEAELASVGIATQIFQIFYLMLFGFTSGAATFAAQFYGAGDYRNIRKVIGFATAVALCAGTLFFVGSVGFTDQILSIYTNDPALREMARGYVQIGAVTFFFLAVSVPLEMAFKATQQTRVPMLISGVVFFTNVILNYLLIFGKCGCPALGVNGASLATTVARSFEVGISIVFAVRKGNCFRGRLRSYLGWNRTLVKRILRNAIPTTANETLWSIGQSMYVAAFSRVGTTAYAAYQAAAAITSLFTYGAFSLGDATLVMVGEKLGEGKKEESYLIAKKLLIIGLCVGLVIGVALILCARPLVGLFELSALGKQYAFRILIVYGGIMALNLYNGMHVTGTLRGGGDTRFAMIAECSTVWLVAVPMAFLATQGLHVPIYIAVLMIKSEELVKGAILTWRFRSKKWINTVITGL